MKKKRKWGRWGVCVAAAGVAFPAAAVEFDWNAYASIVAAGIVSGGERYSDGAGRECPCQVASYTRGSVLQYKKWAVDKESRAGIQGRAYLSNEFTATGQVTTHSGDGGDPKLDILQLRWSPVPSFSVTAGRQRLPMFAYSNYIEVGLAYPWVRLPQDLYGWGIENYDGGELLGRASIGDVDLQGAIYNGRYVDSDAALAELGRVPGDTAQRIEWSSIRGIWGSAQWGDVEVRVNAQRHRERLSGVFAADGPYDYPRDISSRDLAINYVSSTWIMRSEFLRYNLMNEAGGVLIKLRGRFVAGGYQWGKWLPMFTVSRYSVDEDYVVRGQAFSLRYDLSKKVALKSQFDVIRATGEPIVRSLSFAIDTSF